MLADGDAPNPTQSRSRRDPDMHCRTRIAASIGVVTLLTIAAACGSDRTSDGPQSSVAASGGLTPDAAGTVALQMEDIKFDTTTLTVHSGQTVNFRFTNTGMVTHDAFIGDAAAQAEHDAEMAATAGTPGMSGHSGDEPAVTVEPGESATLTYTFDTPGTYEIGCHQPGHYAAGMKVTVKVD